MAKASEAPRKVKIKTVSDKVTKYGSIGYTVRMREKRYEPGMTTASQNIPTTLKECRQWLRHFYLYESYFGQLVDFFTEFPQTGVHNVHPDPAIKREYDELCAKIDIDTYLRDIFFEYFLIADVFPFVYINAQTGEVSEVTLLNPDDVEVRRVITSDREQLYIIPPPELKEVVNTKKPKELYERLSADQIKYIRQGKPIPLNPMQVDHLKRGNSRYSLTGAPPGFRIFRALIQRDKLRDAQWIMADRFTTPVRIFGLLPAEGMRPASNADVQAFVAMLEAADDDPSQVVVTNFNVQAQLLGTAGQWSHIYNDVDTIIDEFLVSFGVNRALLTGEGVTYANASVGLDRLLRQFATAQRLVARVIERLIYEPFAKLHGHVNDDGDPWPADLEWNELVSDKARRQELFRALRNMERPHVSAKTMLEAFGLDSETEAKQIEKERGTVFDMESKGKRDEPLTELEEPLTEERPVEEEALAPREEVPEEEVPEEATEPWVIRRFPERQQSKHAAAEIARIAARLGVDELNDLLEAHGYGIVAL